MPKKKKNTKFSKEMIRKIIRRKKILRSAAKFHGILTLTFFAVYLAVAIFFDPHFIIRDFKDKFAQAADVTVTLRIMGPPDQPIVTADPGCSGASAFVDLDWQDTQDTDNYDVYRDSEILVTGLTDSEYRDENVENEISYIYQVIANGPVGNTASDDTPITADDCEETVPATCEIRTFNGRNIPGISGTPDTEDRKPEFSGTTNIASAQISITVTGDTAISATTSANINGYWEWTAPEKLDYGNHYIIVTATNLSNPSYHATDSLLFQIDEEDEDEDEEEVPVTTTVSPPSPSAPSETVPAPDEQPSPAPEFPESPEVKAPLEFSLDVKNPDGVVYPGEDLNAVLDISHIEKGKKDLEIEFIIYDNKDNVIVTKKQRLVTSENEKVNISIGMPKLIEPGKYKIMAKAVLEKYIIAAEYFFEVREIPLVSLGGYTITTTEIMKKMSWVSLGFLAISLLFIMLIIFEHHLTKKALRYINENMLADWDYFSRGKGVSG
jgi:hypothetical protein